MTIFQLEVGFVVFFLSYTLYQLGQVIFFFGGERGE